MAAVEKDSLSALEELKSTDQLIANSARVELAAVQSKLAELQQEHQAQQSELVKAFLIKEKLSRELEEAKDAQEKSQDKSTNEKVEKLRQKAKSYKEVCNEHTGSFIYVVETGVNSSFILSHAGDFGFAYPSPIKFNSPKQSAHSSVLAWVKKPSGFLDLESPNSSNLLQKNLQLSGLHNQLSGYAFRTLENDCSDWLWF